MYLSSAYRLFAAIWHAGDGVRAGRRRRVHLHRVFLLHLNVWRRLQTHVKCSWIRSRQLHGKKKKGRQMKNATESETRRCYTWELIGNSAVYKSWVFGSRQPELLMFGARLTVWLNPSTQSHSSPGSWPSCPHLHGPWGTPARTSWPAHWTGPPLHSFSGNEWESASGLE